MGQTIKKAIISVSDKTNLDVVLKILKKNKIDVISSGGTYNYIKNKGHKCTEISKYTNFNEMLDGRVKTLHPKIHAGILFNRKKINHRKQMKREKIDQIYLVIVNFYPFKNILEKSSVENKIIEYIDIGGPTLVRAAAKNFSNVTVITDKNDYYALENELKKYGGKTSLKFRQKMAAKAFGITAYYDSVVVDWFNRKLNIKFPEVKTIFGKKINKLRYGENPHQNSSIYISDLYDDNLNLKNLNGKELSYNNYNDIFSALNILFSNNKLPTTVIIKHANPCGVASNKLPLKSFQECKMSDPISAFGGIVACNFKISSKIANEIGKTFFEVIMGKGFDNNALKILKKKKNMRIIDISNFENQNKTSIRFFGKSFLLQDENKMILNKKKLKFVSKIKPTSKELKDIEFAFKVCKFVKSNAIVIAKDLSTIGIGAGQQNRLDSCKIAVSKAKKFQPKKLSNSVAASDAFFPFPDGVQNLINAGIKIIVQPGGSIRDKEIIKLANKSKIKMIFTGLRHFNH